MPVFVVLALAVLAMAAGVVVVAALQLWGAVSRIRNGLEHAAGRIRPLAEELQAELAVTSTEAEAVGTRASAFAAARARRGDAGKRRAR